jgi:prefoldin subunit 5
MIEGRPARGLAAGLLIVTCCAPLGGCIVTDIHEEIVATNQRLESLEARLELIQEANELLDAGNEGLDEVQEKLETMKSIDESLQSVDASLKRLDEHLAALRATIENIDSTIPFLSISGKPEDLEEGEADAEGGTGDDAPADEAGAPE